MELTFLKVLIILLAHIPLAIMMKKTSSVASLHAMAVMCIGIYYALLGRRLVYVAYVCAYLAGAEVLWRMTGARVPWEFGKYSISLLSFLALIRLGGRNLPLKPILFFILIIPGALVTVFQLPGDWAFSFLSFNITGPVSLAFCVAFFSMVKFSEAEMRTLLIWLIAPVVGIAMACFFSTFGSTEQIYFGKGSNMLASGGFGPNQVSAGLGLGVLAVFLAMVDEQTDRKLKLLLLGCIAWFVVQCLLTFSRSGLYLSGLSIMAAGFYLIRSKRARINLVVVMIGMAIAGKVLLPYADRFTGGAMVERFKKTNMTGRDKIIIADFKIWARNPILGIGVGQAKQARASFYKRHSSHTEYTRLLAEHGFLGLLALMVMISMAYTAFFQTRSIKARALVAAFLAFSLLFMFVNGMRLAIPSFLFGLASAKFVFQSNRSQGTAAIPSSPSVTTGQVEQPA